MNIENSEKMTYLVRTVRRLKSGERRSYSDFYLRSESTRDFLIDTDINGSEDNIFAFLIAKDLKGIISRGGKKKTNILVRGNKITVNISNKITIYLKVSCFYTEAQITYFIKKGSKTIFEDFDCVSGNGNIVYFHLSKIVRKAKNADFKFENFIIYLILAGAASLVLPFLIYPQYLL